MGRVVRDVLELLMDGEDAEDEGVGHLWDERVGAVLGGRDYSDEAPALLGIIGPEVREVAVDW